MKPSTTVRQDGENIFEDLKLPDAKAQIAYRSSSLHYRVGLRVGTGVKSGHLTFGFERREGLGLSPFRRRIGSRHHTCLPIRAGSGGRRICRDGLPSPVPSRRGDRGGRRAARCRGMWCDVDRRPSQPCPCSWLGRACPIFWCKAFVVRSLRIRRLIRTSHTPRLAQESTSQSLPSQPHGYGSVRRAGAVAGRRNPNVKCPDLTPSSALAAARWIRGHPPPGRGRLPAGDGWRDRAPGCGTPPGSARPALGRLAARG